MSEPIETAQPSRGELLLYPTEDGKARFYLRVEGGTVKTVLALEAGITDKLWSIEDIAKLLD